MNETCLRPFPGPRCAAPAAPAPPTPPLAAPTRGRGRAPGPRFSSAGCERGCRRKACRIRAADANQRRDRVHVRADRRGNLARPRSTPKWRPPPKSRFRGVEPQGGASSGSISNPKRARSRSLPVSTNAATDAVPGTEARANERPSRDIEVRRRRPRDKSSARAACSQNAAIGRGNVERDAGIGSRMHEIAASPAPMSGAALVRRRRPRG